MPSVISYSQEQKAVFAGMLARDRKIGSKRRDAMLHEFVRRLQRQGNDNVRVSLNWWMKVSGVSQSKTYKHLTMMLKAGVIEREQCSAGRGGRTASVYSLGTNAPKWTHDRINQTMRRQDIRRKQGAYRLYDVLERRRATFLITPITTDYVKVSGLLRNPFLNTGSATAEEIPSGPERGLVLSLNPRRKTKRFALVCQCMKHDCGHDPKKRIKVWLDNFIVTRQQVKAYGLGKLKLTRWEWTCLTRRQRQLLIVSRHSADVVEEAQYRVEPKYAVADALDGRESYRVLRCLHIGRQYDLEDDEDVAILGWRQNSEERSILQWPVSVIRAWLYSKHGRRALAA